MASDTGKPLPFNNVGLFSDHFLSTRLPAESSLWSSEKLAVQTCIEKILAQYEKFTSTYKAANEAQTEDDFIRPVLALLGYSYIVQTKLKHKGKSNQPDYALFTDDKAKKEAGSFKVKEQEAFYNKSLAICDAKYWGRPLDIKLSDKKDTFTNINPSFQIVYYLVGANVDWGILTNGKVWRLYYQKASSRSSTFYEVDLEDLLQKGDTENFLYFYLFFRKEALLKDSEGKTFFEYVVEGSTSYASELSDSLKDKVFDKIFKQLARGFVHYRKKELGVVAETEDSLKEIYSATLTLLYRLLFILYAEARDLLPVREQAYHHYSLSYLKQRVADLRDKNSILTDLSSDLWSDLDTLFKIIDVGDPKLNVPTYNGGLFSQKNPQNDFLKTNKVPDPWLAEALDFLTRDTDKESGKAQFIDYSELEVRHLGSIYEGLLEFHLKIADEEKAVVKEKKREIYKSVTEVKSPKEIISTGDLYLENDKHERKSTGSYYTPDYVVKYIVQNAVGPVLEENLSKVEQLFADVESLRGKARRATRAKRYLTQELSEKKRQAAEELFSLKILDPAMGSGHFLVETVDFLSDHVIKFLNEHPDNPVLEDIESLRSTILADLEKKGISIDQQKLTATNLVRRMVMKRCIYGVDLNLMAVELAKLSLWLHSFTLGAPLSFLDHHLKCGNSLMGVTEIGKVVAPGSAKEGDIKRMLQNVVAISQLTDSTATEVEESHKLYESVLKMQAPFKRRSHISTAAPLLSSITTDSLTRIEQLAESGDLSSAHPDHIATYNAALDLATKKVFFHWPLEFPDVFFSPIREQISPGFDGVIGNPPWGAEFPSLDKTYLRKKYTPIIVRMIDSFMYFLAESLKLCKGKGFIGLVLPSPLLTQVDISKLRKKLLDETRITNLINLGDFVFGADLANPSCILITNKSHNENEHSIRILDLRHLPPPKKEHALTVQQFPYRNIPQSFYNTTHNVSFITKGFESTSLIDKLTGVSSPLKGLISGEIQRGISADYAPASIVLGRDVREKKLEVSVCKRVITGHNVSRYLSHFSGDYIIYLARDDEIKEYPNIEKHLEAFRKEITCPEVKDSKHPWYALHRPRDPQLFKSPKLVGLTTTDRLTVAPEFSDLYAMDNLYIIHLKQQEKLAYWVLLALLNSSLLSFVYRYFAQEEGRVLPQVKAENLYPLPIVNIDVNTPDRDRAVFLDKNKTLYQQCLIKNNVLSVINVVDNCLKRRPGQADVVRDLLGLLAERMGEMNKKKLVETEGFLYWLEVAIGTKIDSLKNKTKVVAYHDGNLEVLVDVLKENRKVLKINPLNKDFFDQLKDAFEKNLAKLLPLKNSIATTDRLIDLIVYRLYGLTEDEIKLVESEAE